MPTDDTRPDPRTAVLEELAARLHHENCVHDSAGGRFCWSLALIFEGRLAPRRDDALLREVAELLHEDCCTDDACEGWGRVSSWGKRGWMEVAQRVLAKIDGKPDPEWRSFAATEKGADHAD